MVKPAVTSTIKLGKNSDVLGLGAADEVCSQRPPKQKNKKYTSLASPYRARLPGLTYGFETLHLVFLFIALCLQQVQSKREQLIPNSFLRACTVGPKQWNRRPMFAR